MSTALYRRYRPETFAEVIGQEHVTVPLSAALAKNRINHAYLFSGPRGCGKTTSARILARCLNCAQGPTASPCGACPSCVELARGGPGSLDVVEIDAASHGGVDDARSLRERAVFAPARDRFKVFIIDEAHMVSTQGFNALLKIVEEPPPHVRFVFATTEPEKVIGTIRSRTHHYPFRLVPPERLQAYLGQLCEAEGVPVGPAVLPLVVRAGAGSVRDSLSVLDQLIAGAGEEGLTYPLAVSLLGYTDAALLDEVVDGLAAGDGRAVFAVVDRIISSGHDPRRFVEDLLERLRDLLVVAAVPDAGHSLLRGLPTDQFERMKGQAARFGRAELSRSADVVNTALTEMTGATSPRLQLELLVARLLLPGSEDGERALAARVDRIEKRIGVVAPGVPLSSAVLTPSPDAALPAGTPARPAPARVTSAEQRPAAVRPVEPAAQPAAPQPAAPQPSAGPAPAPASAAAPPGMVTPDGSPVDTVRRMWPDVLTALRGLRRMTWTLVSGYAQVLDVDAERLLLGFDSAGRASSFSKGSHAEYLRQALIDVIGLDCRIEAVAGDAAGRGAAAAAPARPAAGEPPGWGPPPESRPSPAPASTPSRPAAPVRGAASRARRPAPPPDDGIPLPPEPPADEPPPEDDFDPYARPPGPLSTHRPEPKVPGAHSALSTGTAASAAGAPSRYDALRAALPRRERPAGAAAVTAPEAVPVTVVPAGDDEPSADDPDVEESGLVGPSVVVQLLGGQVIEEREE